MPNIGIEELRQRVSQLTNDELWRMVNVEAAQYREEARAVAKNEIARRGAAFQPLIEAQAMAAEEAAPGGYSEEEQIRINEKTWDKDSKPIYTIGISLACWLTYLYFAVTEPAQIWVAPVIACGVGAGLDVLRVVSSKEHTYIKWRQTFKSAATISLLSVGVAILAHTVFLLLRASWYELMK